MNVDVSIPSNFKKTQRAVGFEVVLFSPYLKNLYPPKSWIAGSVIPGRPVMFQLA